MHCRIQHVLKLHLYNDGNYPLSGTFDIHDSLLFGLTAICKWLVVTILAEFNYIT